MRLDIDIVRMSLRLVQAAVSVSLFGRLNRSLTTGPGEQNKKTYYCGYKWKKKSMARVLLRLCADAAHKRVSGEAEGAVRRDRNIYFIHALAHTRILEGGTHTKQQLAHTTS